MRILPLSLSLAEILIGLELGADMAGITDDVEKKQAADHPSIGSPKALDLESIEKIEPEIILADETENRPEQIRDLKKKHRVLSFEVRSIPQVLDTIQTFGRIFDKIPEASFMGAEVLTAHKTNLKSFEGSKPVPALVLLWNQPYVTVNFDTYISRLLKASGAYNVFHQDPVREFPIEMEDMIEKNPEILFLAGEPFAFRKRHIAGFRKYRIFSKIRIELVDGRLLSTFGPRTGEALRYFRSILSPQPTLKSE